MAGREVRVYKPKLESRRKPKTDIRRQRALNDGDTVLTEKTSLGFEAFQKGQS
jgi:hypothetical protein